MMFLKWDVMASIPSVVICTQSTLLIISALSQNRSTILRMTPVRINTSFKERPLLVFERDLKIDSMNQIANFLAWFWSKVLVFSIFLFEQILLLFFSKIQRQEKPWNWDASSVDHMNADHILKYLVAVLWRLAPAGAGSNNCQHLVRSLSGPAR